MAIKKHHEKVFSNEKSKINEQTDAELVAQARMRAKQCALEVEDLFSAYGNWSEFYVRVVFMNALMWMMADIHAMGMKYILIRKEEFSGALGTLYNIIPNLSPFSFIQNLPKEHQGDEIEEIRMAIDYGMIFGLIYTAYNYKTDQRFHVLRSGFYYFISISLVYINYAPLTKISVCLATTFAQTCYITVFIHTMQSLPTHLRPLAVLVLQSFENMGTVLVRLIFRITGDIFVVNMCTWPIFLTMAIFYYKYCPTSLLNDVVNKNSRVIKEELNEWLGNENIIDAEALIDDTMFRGDPVIRHWRRILNLLAIRSFSQKLFTLVFFTALYAKVEKSVSFYGLRKVMGLANFELRVTRDMLHFTAAIVLVLLIYWKSRRHTIIFSCLVIIFSITFMIHLPMDKFNTCDSASTISASDKLLGTIVTFIVVIASRSLILVSRLMLIEHIPVQQQIIFYPLAAAFRFPIEYLCNLCNEYWNLKEVHPAGEMFPTFILILIATVLGLALDGTSKNPLTSTHVNCYHIKLRRYPKIPVYDDDTEMDGVDTISDKASE